jgi:hypothetical protein
LSYTFFSTTDICRLLGNGFCCIYLAGITYQTLFSRAYGGISGNENCFLSGIDARDLLTTEDLVSLRDYTVYAQTDSVYCKSSSGSGGGGGGGGGNRDDDGKSVIFNPDSALTAIEQSSQNVRGSIAATTSST